MLAPPDAALYAHEALDAWSEGQSAIAGMRREALGASMQDGWTQADLGNLLDVSRQRVHQLMREGQEEGGSL